MMSTGLVRCFIAFDINDETVLKRLVEIQRMLEETGADLKLVEPKNIHVTLRFLGEVQPAMAESISKEMDGVSFSPFDVELNGAGVFPNMRRINVVWVGIRKGVVELEKIFEQLDVGLARLGFKQDRRGFSPHITIARVRTAKNKEMLAHRIIELRDYEFGVIRADMLKLMRSVLKPEGPIYTALHEVRK